MRIKMSKDLTNSAIDRQNVLNNQYALVKAEEYLALGGTAFAGETVFTKAQIVALFNISDATVERYLATHDDELRLNGYTVLKGTKLKNFKGLVDVSLIGEGNKAPALGIFSFRAVLNLAMLLTESDRAQAIRTRMLDIVMDVLAERAGGHTRFINQRDEAYLPAAYQEFSYRKIFTNALRDCLEMGNIKYGIYTDRIYQVVFKERSKEYKKILNLAEKDNPRETMYAEVLQAIASIENGLANQMVEKSSTLKRKLVPKELDEMIAGVERNPYLAPQLDAARTRMASRDLHFRDALHQKLESYVQCVPIADFERFLGETSQSLESRLSDPKTLEVFKRLKDR